MPIGAADLIDVKPGIYEPANRFAQPKNEKEYNALPNGALYTDPDDGPSIVYKKGFGVFKITPPQTTPSLIPKGTEA